MFNEGVSSPEPEPASPELKAYLSLIFVTLSQNQTLLGSAGISHDRSALGRVNDLSLQALRFAIEDDKFLDNERSDYDEQTSWDAILAQIDQKEKQMPLPDMATLSDQKRSLLVKTCVLMDIAMMAEKRKGDEGMSENHPILLLVSKARELLGKMIPESEIAPIRDEIVDDPDKANQFYHHFRIELRDLIFP